MKIGFIGLGNAGGKLAGTLLRNGHALTVRDLDPQLVQAFEQRGAAPAASPREMAARLRELGLEPVWKDWDAALAAG